MTRVPRCLKQLFLSSILYVSGPRHMEPDLGVLRAMQSSTLLSLTVAESHGNREVSTVVDQD